MSFQDWASRVPYVTTSGPLSAARTGPVGVFNQSHEGRGHEDEGSLRELEETNRNDVRRTLTRWFYEAHGARELEERRGALWARTDLLQWSVALPVLSHLFSQLLQFVEQ